MNRRVLAISFGFSFAIVISIVLALALSEGEASATAYTASFGPGNWSDSTRWFPSGIPGSGPGDTATIQSPITMDYVIAPANALAGMTVSAGGTLNLTTGTLSLGTGTNNMNGTFNMSGGTLSLGAGITISSASPAPFTWSGGTITGPSGINVNSGPFAWSGGTWSAASLLAMAPGITTTISGA